MRIKNIPIVSANKTTDPVNTICDLKWTYPLFNFGRGEYRTCCRSPGNIVTDKELDDLGTNAFINHPREIQQRLDLIKGKRIDDCQSCWNLEDRGLSSPREPQRFHYFMRRNGYIDQKLEYNPDKVTETLSSITDINHPSLVSKNPYMVELILGNTCDMKCMYCSHHYSSQWATERIKYGEITQEQYDIEFPKPSEKFTETFWKWFNETGRYGVYRLGIIGGEPLITPELYPMLEKLIASVEEIENQRNNKITLFFVTNMNTPNAYSEKFYKFLPKLTKLFNVEILISMESTNERAEYIRNGLDWEVFDKNVNKLLSQTELKFDVAFLPSLNVLSISSLGELVKYVTNLYFTYRRPIGIRQNIINFPDWQNPGILTSDFADYIDPVVEYMKENVASIPAVTDIHGRYETYISFLENLRDTIRNNKNSNTTLQKKFAEWFDEYDERRNLSLVKTFPEYKQFYEYCKSL